MRKRKNCCPGNTEDRTEERITEIRFSDPALEELFRTDLAKMYEMYGLDGGVET